MFLNVEHLGFINFQVTDFTFSYLGWNTNKITVLGVWGTHLQKTLLWEKQQE